MQGRYRPDTLTFVCISTGDLEWNPYATSQYNTVHTTAHVGAVVHGRPRGTHRMGLNSNRGGACIRNDR